eukprot:m.30427 g.30427  ORF g.30427 m.30427 type:complete len:837 (-) comp9433_c0_seq1:60-2570(-)
MLRTLFLAVACALIATALLPHVCVSDAAADDTATVDDSAPKVDEQIVVDTATDAGTVEREEEAIKYDGLSVDETKKLRESAEKHEFQAEVNRMMKLIINSLYKNKEIFLRELISNASDALDKVRFLSLKDSNYLGANTDLHIKIHVDKENKVLHITDTGVGMTKQDLVNNLGTIAKSGTSEFLQAAADGSSDTSSLIGQFGVGFYSAFLVADTVVVTTKNNDDKQYIWTSDASSFSIAEDPREDEQLGRGTRVSLYLKEEAQDFLETKTIQDLVKKYSEFINFDIFLYTSKTIEVDAEEEDDEEEDDGEDAAEDAGEDKEDDEADVEEEEDDADKTEEKKKVEKTVWDWEIINANKPIWTRTPKDVEDEEYKKFYQAFSKDSKDPTGWIHFTAEGEVTFRAILFIPPEAPAGFFSEYGRHATNIKMYVRRVFITDEFDDMMPKYLSFIRGVVDSDDLPLNVSRETLQQHKLLKVIKKKLVRKALEMIKKLEPEQFKKFWAEFGTSIKLGLIEDYSNRTRLAKLLRFFSSNDPEELTSLEDYVSRMKESQETIFFIAGANREEVEKSPFVERLLKRGYEVLYLIEPVDEYTIQNLPEFDGKKFQNVAKEGLKFGDESEAEKKAKEELEGKFEPLTKWLGEELKEDIEKAVVSDRLSDSPCALVASSYGWSGNMERIMSSQAYAKAGDTQNSFYAKQKKTLEINPRHPLIKNLLSRVAELEGDKQDDDEYKTTTIELSQVLIDTARLRSGFLLQDSASFASRIEKVLRMSVGVPLDEAVEEEPEYPADAPAAAEEEEVDADEDDEDDEGGEEVAAPQEDDVAAEDDVQGEEAPTHSEL